jgi:hypothetical protein
MYASIPISDEYINSSKQLCEQKFEEILTSVEHGSISSKVSGILACCGIVLVASLSFFPHLLSLSPFAAVLDLYLLGFGIIGVLLECKEHLLTKAYLDWLRQEALFLYRPYGRGLFYFFVGILMASIGGLLGLLVGVYTAATGAFIFVTSREAIKSAERMKESQNIGSRA